MTCSFSQDNHLWKLCLKGKNALMHIQLTHWKWKRAGSRIHVGKWEPWKIKLWFEWVGEIPKLRPRKIIETLQSFNVLELNKISDSSQ